MNTIQLHPVADYSAGIALPLFLLLPVIVVVLVVAYSSDHEKHKALYLSTLIVSAIIVVVLLGTSIFFIDKQITQTDEVNTYNMSEFSKYSMIISKDKDAENCKDKDAENSWYATATCKSDDVKDAINNPTRRTTLEFPAVNEKTGGSVNVRIIIDNDYKLRLFTQQGSSDSTWKIVEPSSK